MRGLEYSPRQCTKLTCKEQSSFDSFFVGSSTKIAIDKGKWKLTVAHHEAHAVLDGPVSSYALGKHSWSVLNDECYNGSYKAYLKLTGCNEYEYTCDDGQCVNMTRRCDQFPNCHDGSDEKDCKLIVLNEGYNKGVPPFIMKMYNGGEIVPTAVNVSVNLFNVMSMDEVENTIDLKFEITMDWFDRRLTYNNLKPDHFFLNKLDENDIRQIWLPLITYQNTDQFQTTRLERTGDQWTSTVLIVREQSDFKRLLFIGPESDHWECLSVTD